MNSTYLLYCDFQLAVLCIQWCSQHVPLQNWRACSIVAACALVIFRCQTFLYLPSPEDNLFTHDLTLSLEKTCIQWMTEEDKGPDTPQHLEKPQNVHCSFRDSNGIEWLFPRRHHSPTSPLPRDALLLTIPCPQKELIWKVFPIKL